MDFDELDQVLDSKVGERHHTLVVGAVYPDDPVFGVHLVGDVKEPVLVLAEILGDAADRRDAMDLVDVHDQAALAGIADGRGVQFQGSNSSSR